MFVELGNTLINIDKIEYLDRFKTTQYNKHIIVVRQGHFHVSPDDFKMIATMLEERKDTIKLQHYSGHVYTVVTDKIIGVQHIKDRWTKFTRVFMKLDIIETNYDTYDGIKEKLLK
jgi:hypothetical protein